MAVVSPRPLPDQPTVIVLRALPGLGDWLCAEPTLRALRAARPGARIHLVALASTRELIGRFGRLIDGFHAFPGWPGLPDRPVDVAAIPGFLAALQGLEADLAIQLHGSGEVTNELVELFGARHVAGFVRPGSRSPDPARFVPWRETEPEVRRGLHLLTRLGIDARDTRLSFPLDPDARTAAAELLAAAGVAPGSVVLHPGSNRPENRWSPAAFAAVGRELAARGERVVVTGGPGEERLTAEVATDIPGAVDLGGRTNLDTLGWLLRSARLLVTNDTGISHVADALGVPSVVVFANDPGPRAARWAPLDRQRHIAVSGVGGGPSIEIVAGHARGLLGQLDRGVPESIRISGERAVPTPLAAAATRRSRSRSGTGASDRAGVVA